MLKMLPEEILALIYVTGNSVYMAMVLLRKTQDFIGLVIAVIAHAGNVNIRGVGLVGYETRKIGCDGIENGKRKTEKSICSKRENITTGRNQKRKE